MSSTKITGGRIGGAAGTGHPRMRLEHRVPLAAAFALAHAGEGFTIPMLAAALDCSEEVAGYTRSELERGLRPRRSSSATSAGRRPTRIATTTATFTAWRRGDRHREWRGAAAPQHCQRVTTTWPLARPHQHDRGAPGDLRARSRGGAELPVSADRFGLVGLQARGETSACWLCRRRAATRRDPGRSTRPARRSARPGRQAYSARAWRRCCMQRG